MFTYNNSTLFSMGPVKIKHFLEGVVANDITIQNKERFFVGQQNVLS